jgi:hypothetical protein
MLATINLKILGPASARWMWTSACAIADSSFKRFDVDDNPSSVALEGIIQSAGMPMAEAPPPTVFRGGVVDASSSQCVDVRHWNQEICHG